MRTLLSFLCCGFTAAIARESAAATAAKLHVPAGSRGVEEVLQLVGQAVKSPILVGERVAVSGAAKLRLQRELVLAGADWENALASLLATRNLVLTFDPERKRHEVMAAAHARRHFSVRHRNR